MQICFHIRFLFCIALFVSFLQGCAPLYFHPEKHSYQPSLPEMKPPKVALVLGGGGARGLAHVGVLEVLLKAGINPDLIVGCSAGAIVGGIYADHPDIDYVKNLFMEKKRKHLLEFSLSYLPYGVTDGNTLSRFLKKELVAKNFEDLKIPFVAVATNLQFGELAAFGSGPFLERSILASAAYPGVFVPVCIHQQYFVDGGVVDPVPVQVARKLGAEFVIAVDLSGGLSKSAPSNLMGVVRRSLEISYIHQSKLLSKEADFVIRIPFTEEGTFEEGINGHIYELGYKTAEEALGELQKKLNTKLKSKRSHSKKKRIMQ